MKLTKRQVELIYNLLGTYQASYFELCGFSPEKATIVIFNGGEYTICKTDYDVVCEIIDYIKGVKHE